MGRADHAAVTAVMGTDTQRFPPDHAQVEALIRDLGAIRADMVTAETRLAPTIAAVHRSQQESARNLLHYLALRGHDLRRLQERLAPLGLSSLGRTESHAMATLDAVMQVLQILAGHPVPGPSVSAPPVDFAGGRTLLEHHTQALLGARPHGRGVRIMVTMPGTAATDYPLVRDLLAGGMDVMRINCAHDGPEVWAGMIAHLRAAEREVGRQARVLMDIPGPKLRTGPMAPGPAVLKWRPRRDEFGRVVSPARIWLTPDTAMCPPPAPADACLPVGREWLAQLRQGEEIGLTDTRGARRSLRVVAASGAGWWTECERTAYVAPGIGLHRAHAQRGSAGVPIEETVIGQVSPKAQAILLHKGDTLILTRDLRPGQPTVHDADGRVVSPATIGCTLPEIFADVQPGRRIWLDDGKIGGIIQAVNHDEIRVTITQARPGGERLGADKGINLPDSALTLPALTPQDIASLPFVATHADMVGYSFVRRADDVAALHDQLARTGGQHLGIVLKIETRSAVERLPELLLAAMHGPAAGVMIARGDLAVECGYERLAELQEEILCIAEAAHMPVIWATQVLESLAQVGLPSRAEISDASMGERAECVMLNKGPYIVEAVRVLDDILRRMQDHQSKKSALLRRLHLARNFWPGERKCP